MNSLPDYQETRARLLDGTWRCAEVLEYCLQRAEAARHSNAYVEVYAEAARARALALDALPDKAALPLFGLVVSLKDVLCHAGHAVTAASQILQGFRAPFSATAVERLLAAGAIVIGRTNCDEFAMGSANEHSFYGPVQHGSHPGYVPGGSSGGAAVAVQLRTCHVSLGSDTGGSVRQPAAFCGVFGLKPSYGRISRHGLLAYASSFDQIGILALSAADLAAVLACIAGADAHDATASTLPLGDYVAACRQVAPPRRIAYFPDLHADPSVAPPIREALEAELLALQGRGHTLLPRHFAWWPYLVPTYYVLAAAEASSNLSRYDGLRYGWQAPAQPGDDWQQHYRRTRSQGFGSEVKRRIMLGAFVLSAGHADAYYGQAQRVRRLIRDAFLDILQEADALFMPVSPVLPWRIGEQAADPLAAYTADIFSVAANLAGLPALAVPLGQDAATGLPIGAQYMAAPFAEAALLALAMPYRAPVH